MIYGPTGKNIARAALAVASSGQKVSEYCTEPDDNADFS